MSEISAGELMAILDLLEIKRGAELRCWVCDAKAWSARETDRQVQLICGNCKHVVAFTDEIARVF